MIWCGHFVFFCKLDAADMTWNIHIHGSHFLRYEWLNQGVGVRKCDWGGWLVIMEVMKSQWITFHISPVPLPYYSQQNHFLATYLEAPFNFFSFSAFFFFFSIIMTELHVLLLESIIFLLISLNLSLETCYCWPL